MKRTKKVSVVQEKKPVVVEEKKVEPVPILIKKEYKVVSAAVKDGSFRIFDNIITDMITNGGWKPVGGVSVVTMSASAWLLSQAMIKE